MSGKEHTVIRYFYDVPTQFSPEGCVEWRVLPDGTTQSRQRIRRRPETAVWGGALYCLRTLLKSPEIVEVPASHRRFREAP